MSAAELQSWESERSRRNHLRREYGLSIEEYETLVAKQNGMCAICGKPNLRGDTLLKLGVDHNHKTGSRRGLLCDPCNIGIGQLREDPTLLRAAADYLERHEVAHASER